MSKRDAVEALKTFGLSNYEARVFVTLHQIGGGTAQAVSKSSDVPRSQVYGAADDLADRGLVEVVEASPKEYRPVALETARAILDERIREERDRAFENLESVRTESRDHPGGSVSTLRGRQPIDARLAEMVRTAESTLVLVVPSGEYLSTAVRTALEDRAGAGVSVTVVTEDRSLAAALEQHQSVTVAVDPAGTTGYTGRILLVDDRAILLSVLMDDDDTEPMDEMALWTDESKIAGILAEFIHAGIKRVLEGPGRE